METPVRHDRFTKIYLLVWGIFILIALAGFIFYKFGFRLSKGFEPVKVGTIELSANVTGLQIFLDNRERKLTPASGIYSLGSITPGLHSILVSEPGFWPWTKNVTVNTDSTTKIFAFLFPMNGISATAVPSGTDYKNAFQKITANVVPQPKTDSPAYASNESLIGWLEGNVPNLKISADKSTALFAEDNNTIYAAWISETDPPAHYFCEENPCKMELPVTITSDSIKNIDFYKGRPDVIIFATGAAIYAIDIGHEGTQNFQPIYKGTDPSFYESPDGTLYIKDGVTILQATL